MKKIAFLHCLSSAVLTAAMLCVSPAWAANTKTSVDQVTETVTLSTNVDYIVKSDTPFGTDGIVNITNTDHAVLILSSVKPSKALSLLTKHVQINGKRAVDATNCQVKLYNRGCIIMPYSKDLKPLTVYSEPNFKGDVCNDFGLEHSGGFMNTLTDKKLNNRIRSFKLKRGYMVTFANRARGRGYSRCFIAADRDLEMAEMPSVLDKSISSYRVFKWYDTGKQQLAAAGGDFNACAALNVTSTYSWNEGISMLPDVECVPHHIYEDYPSAAGCGQVTYSPHMKTNNEPGNSADDHPQSVETVLSNWENLMATGMRLCSPSSHDGSLGHLTEFLSEIDKRGWRCDIIDLHCYWPEGSFGNIQNWANDWKRPIWVSEWVWGASWNSNGAFASGVTQAQNKAAVERICNNMNGMSCVERYYYWNGEREPSRIYNNGSLTTTGKYYATIDGGVGYNGKMNYIPATPPMGDPSELAVNYDSDRKVAVLTWHEPNGELNNGIYVDRRSSDTGAFSQVAEISMQEDEADYMYEDPGAVIGWQYRIRVVDGNGKARVTKPVMVVATDLKAGDGLILNDEERFIGGNLIVNGSFDMGLYGWNDGTGSQLTSPWFQAVPVGGFGGGSYLQCYGHGAADTNQAINTVFDVKPNTDYYFSGAACNNAATMQQIVLSSDDGQTTEVVNFLSNTTSTWASKFFTFNTGSYTKVVLTFRNLGAKSQFDELVLCQLFANQQDALADGVQKALLRAEAFKSWNTRYPFLNTDLSQNVGEVGGTGEAALANVNHAVDNAIKAVAALSHIDSLATVAAAVLPLQLDGFEAVEQALETAKKATTAAAVIAADRQLADLLGKYLPLTTLKGKVQSPAFATTTGWTTKCGTYTGGDQRTNSVEGMSFWNAWWSGLNASEGQAKTMAVRQDITGLSHGLYALQCQATTEHFCLSDQHAFLIADGKTVNSPVLTADYYDLPTVSTEDCWQTLTTTPVYLDDDASLTIGFTGSKQGAVDGAWHRVGDIKAATDNREGWWCATNFVLCFSPMYKKTVTPNQWGTICLPYALKSTAHVKLFIVAGLTADYAAICLKEVSEVPAGTPCIYRSDMADATFCEQGTAASSPAVGRLRGWFVHSATLRVPSNYYILENGEWNKVTSDNRPLMGDNYVAFMRSFDDAQGGVVQLYTNWDGPTIPVNGMSEAELKYLKTEAQEATGISTVKTAEAKSARYSVGGQRTPATANKGLYINIKNGRAHKSIVK